MSGSVTASDRHCPGRSVRAGSRVAVLSSLFAAVGAAPASADPREVTHALQHHASDVGALLVLALGVLIGLAFAIRRPRVVATVALALLVGLLGLESAVHSVHHVSDPDAAASCAVFAASQHVAGTGAEVLDLASPTPAGVPVALAGAERPRPLPAFSAHEGRAPPARLSA